MSSEKLADLNHNLLTSLPADMAHQLQGRSQRGEWLLSSEKASDITVALKGEEDDETRVGNVETGSRSRAAAGMRLYGTS